MDKVRGKDQNSKLHAMLGDLEKQIEHYGQKYTVSIWKRLCIASWLRAEGENPIMIQALDGHGIDVIFEKSSKLSVKRMTSLIEWVYMFGAENNVVWTEKIPKEYDQYIN